MATTAAAQTKGSKRHLLMNALLGRCRQHSILVQIEIRGQSQKWHGPRSLWFRASRRRHLEPALRHRERVVAEINIAGLLAALVHRKIDDPAEAEGALFDEPQFTADTATRRGRKGHRLGRPTADEEHRIAVDEAKLGA